VTAQHSCLQQVGGGIDKTSFAFAKEDVVNVEDCGAEKFMC